MRRIDVKNDSQIWELLSDSTDTSSPTFHVGVIPSVAQQALSGAGAVDEEIFYTAVTTTGADALTLADGTLPGQLKLVHMVVDGGEGTLTPTNLVGGTTITFADAGDAAILQWTTDGWLPLALLNFADGATAPVLA